MSSCTQEVWDDPSPSIDVWNLIGNATETWTDLDIDDFKTVSFFEDKVVNSLSADLSSWIKYEGSTYKVSTLRYLHYINWIIPWTEETVKINWNEYSKNIETDDELNEFAISLWDLVFDSISYKALSLDDIKYVSWDKWVNWLSFMIYFDEQTKDYRANQLKKFFQNQKTENFPVKFAYRTTKSDWTSIKSWKWFMEYSFKNDENTFKWPCLARDWTWDPNFFKDDNEDFSKYSPTKMWFSLTREWECFSNDSTIAWLCTKWLKTIASNNKTFFSSDWSLKEDYAIWSWSTVRIDWIEFTTWSWALCSLFDNFTHIDATNWAECWAQDDKWRWVNDYRWKVTFRVKKESFCVAWDSLYDEPYYPFMACNLDKTRTNNFKLYNNSWIEEDKSAEEQCWNKDHEWYLVKNLWRWHPRACLINDFRCAWASLECAQEWKCWTWCWEWNDKVVLRKNSVCYYEQGEWKESKKDAMQNCSIETKTTALDDEGILKVYNPDKIKDPIWMPSNYFCKRESWEFCPNASPPICECWNSNSWKTPKCPESSLLATVEFCNQAEWSRKVVVGDCKSWMAKLQSCEINPDINNKETQAKTVKVSFNPWQNNELKAFFDIWSALGNSLGNAVWGGLTESITKSIWDNFIGNVVWQTVWWVANAWIKSLFAPDPPRPQAASSRQAMQPNSSNTYNYSVDNWWNIIANQTWANTAVAKNGYVWTDRTDCAEICWSMKINWSTITGISSSSATNIAWKTYLWKKVATIEECNSESAKKELTCTTWTTYDWITYSLWLDSNGQSDPLYNMASCTVDDANKLASISLTNEYWWTLNDWVVSGLLTHLKIKVKAFSTKSSTTAIKWKWRLQSASGSQCPWVSTDFETLTSDAVLVDSWYPTSSSDGQQGIRTDSWCSFEVLMENANNPWTYSSIANNTFKVKWNTSACTYSKTPNSPITWDTWTANFYSEEKPSTSCDKVLVKTLKCDKWNWINPATQEIENPENDAATYFLKCYKPCTALSWCGDWTNKPSWANCCDTTKWKYECNDWNWNLLISWSWSCTP